VLLKELLHRAGGHKATAQRFFDGNDGVDEEEEGYEWLLFGGT